MVGGCVRDRLYGVEPKDVDVEVFGVGEDRLAAMLSEVAPHVLKVGRSFPVWKIWGGATSQDQAIDVALPRKEIKTGEHHTAFAVEADPGLSFGEAAERRDFTINAMAVDPLTDELLDPHGGRADFEIGQLRHVSEKFSEDPLRVLRGMQFCGRFSLTAHPDTIELCRTLTPQGLSRERLFEEWKKFLLKSKSPSKGLRFLAQTGWIKHFPELAALDGIQQDPHWHPEGDALAHTAHCLDAFAQKRTGDPVRDLRIGFAVLCHDFGKATHTQFIDGRWRSRGHEEAGGKPTQKFIGRMTEQSELIHSVCALVVRHMSPKAYYASVKKSGNLMSMDSAIRRMAVGLSNEGASIEDLCLVCECDMAGRPPNPPLSPETAWLRDRARQVNVLRNRPESLLLGRDLIALGQSPGPKFKELLDAAFQRQLSGELKSKEEALAMVQVWIETGVPTQTDTLDAMHERGQNGAASMLPAPKPNPAYVEFDR